jgi:hypothetical protein
VAIAGVVFQGTSHESGRNATVTLYPDRIERVKEKSLTSFSKASQASEVTPMRAVSSVQTQKDGMLYTKVTVHASGNPIEFRFAHEEARQFKDAISEILLKGSAVASTFSAAPAVDTPTDPLDQLKKTRRAPRRGNHFARGV